MANSKPAVRPVSMKATKGRATTTRVAAASQLGEGDSGDVLTRQIAEQTAELARIMAAIDEGLDDIDRLRGFRIAGCP